MSEPDFEPHAVDEPDDGAIDKWTIRPIVGQDGSGQLGFTWGDAAGVMELDEARNFAMILLETAAAVDIEAAMMRYLLNNPDATVEGAARIVAAFRRFRAREHAEEVVA